MRLFLRFDPQTSREEKKWGGQGGEGHIEIEKSKTCAIYRAKQLKSLEEKI